MRVEAIGREQLESGAFRIKPVGLKRWVEAVMVVYGDCTVEIGQSRRTAAIGHENTGPSLPQRLDATG